jgi:hypothetical protein
LFRLENRACLSRGVQVAGAACSDEDCGSSRRPGAEDRDGCIGQILGGRAIGRSGGALCHLHRARGDEEREFLG